MTPVGTPRTTAPATATNPASDQRRAGHARRARSRSSALGAGCVAIHVTAATSFSSAVHIDGVAVDAQLYARQRPRCRPGDNRRATAGIELGAMAAAEKQTTVRIEADDALGVGADRAVGHQPVLGQADHDGRLPAAGQLEQARLADRDLPQIADLPRPGAAGGRA